MPPLNCHRKTTMKRILFGTMPGVTLGSDAGAAVLLT